MSLERFPKAFRLSGQVRTDRLFALGRSLKAWPFKIVYAQVPVEEGATPLPRVLFSVSKRQFKHAVDRNTIRRRCREAYRKAVRQTLLPAVTATGQDLHMAFIYTGGKTILTPEELNRKLTSALKRLALEIGGAKEANPPPPDVSQPE